MANKVKRPPPLGTVLPNSEELAQALSAKFVWTSRSDCKDCHTELTNQEKRIDGKYCKACYTRRWG